MAKLDELKQEAKELGINYGANIGEAKLSEKIEAHYKALETSVVTVEEEPEEVEETPKEKKKETLEQIMGKIAIDAEKRARVTHIIVITDNDQRENNYTTTVPVTCGNTHFELGTMRIPLNVPVEVMQGFIDVLKEVRIPMHVRNADGSTKTVVRNRYAISYEDELKKEKE